jgi:hypothetical protein
LKDGISVFKNITAKLLEDVNATAHIETIELNSYFGLINIIIETFNEIYVPYIEILLRTPKAASRANIA